MEQGWELAEAPEGDNGGKKNNVAGHKQGNFDVQAEHSMQQNQ
jgi:hypothetical protein